MVNKFINWLEKVENRPKRGAMAWKEIDGDAAGGVFNVT